MAERGLSVGHSSGDTIDFMLSPKRDAVAAKHFL
jgi:transposase-like protein